MIPWWILSRSKFLRVRVLKRDVVGWNAWRTNSFEKDIDLSSADLEGATLTYAELYSVDLSGANLSGADLTGANLITTDLLDSTLMISYEHLVLVDEMIDHLRSAAGGITTDDISLAVEEIRQHAHPSPDYISSDFTVQRMKQDVYYSEFFGRTAPSYEDWYEKAHAKVADILRRTSGDDDLDPDTAERLAVLEARLHEDDGAWRTGEGAWWTPYVRDFT